MLGISQSRAGAIVDCPGCGRSLRVPNSDGSVDPMPTSSLDSEGSGSLIAALEQLSAIRLPVESRPSELTVDLKPDRDRIPAVEILQHELSADPDTHQTKRPNKNGSAGRNILSLRCISALCCVSLLIGVIIGCVLYPVIFAQQRTKLAGTGSVDQSSAATIDLSAPGRVVQTEQSAIVSGFVSGRITWKNGEGTELPDSAALVLLLPSRHPGVMKLDGTSLREVRMSTDQQAIAAALLQFGGSFTRADDDGRFRLPRLSESEMQLVVVSRHRSHQDDQNVLPAISEVLDRYFTSPVPFTGRLMVVHQLLEAVPQNSPSGDLTLSVSIP